MFTGYSQREGCAWWCLLPALLGIVFSTPILAQVDPGPRGGVAGAGGPLPGLSDAELALFNQGKDTFQEVGSVTGTEPGAGGAGLGPRFNMNSCGGCHLQPAFGGSSPSPLSQQNPAPNPQVAMATQYGARNSVPDFITLAGPVREVRFKRKPDGSADGGVHALFVISGRGDAGTCNIQQENFAAAVANGNAIFRIPTPTFGAGLIEAISDSTILANKNASPRLKALRGIAGHENRNGNDGTITRFGWKAQNKSLMIFSGEAYNVEQGVTNELFPTERDETPGCATNGTAEDHDDVALFAAFMRFLAAPTRAPQNPSTLRGALFFVDVGCALCHTPTLTTGLSSSPALSNKTAALGSDLLVHHMGSGLADGVFQGNAAGDEFRTAPLWGVSQRFFFLHDGRSTDLLDAIHQHQSSGSEANATIRVFNGNAPTFSGHTMSVADRQDLLNFLRSL